MKCEPTINRLSQLFITAFCIAAVACPQSILACMGSSGPVCTLNPSACLKSMVLTKSVPGPVFPIPPSGSGLLSVSNNLFITCPATNNCGIGCNNVGVPVSASLTVSLVPPAPPACPPGSPTLSATISTAGGTMALPNCSSAGIFNPYSVAVTIPSGTCPGLYTVVGTTTITFSDGIVLTQTGDTVVCLVDPAPGLPGVPRLSVELITPSFPRMAPGDQHVATYRVVNNDPSNSVTLTAYATSKQGAVRPQGGNERQGVFAISSPFGDDFPIMFNPGVSCIPLPNHPYTQPEINIPLPVIPPGGNNLVTVGIRSYGQCASGSCSESTLRVQGTFSDGSPALSCASMALFGDTSVPSQSCALQVNDCNHNGIPDALDIASRRSQDQNYNALPDECEEAINVPFFSSASPTNPMPGAPIQVQVAFNEIFPMSNVWANGSSLTRTQLISTPFWVGTIPADTRPGPQTVYFLARNVLGGLSSYIATYDVQPPPPPPQISRLYLDANKNVIIEHNGAATGRDVYVEESTDVTCQTCWTPRPGGPHPSPHNAGMAIGTRFFRTAIYSRVTGGQGVTFNQIDFTWAGAVISNSALGQVTVDVAALRAATGIQQGFINIFTGFGWVVQNLPVFADFTYPKISSTFKLNSKSGVNITGIGGRVLFSPTPQTQPSSGLTSTFIVGNTTFNAQGKNVTVAPTYTPTNPPTIGFSLGGLIEEWYQPGHPNIETADNQCGPAAKANSLQWLENTYNLNIPQPNVPGLDGDGSLVGALETAMGRTFRDRRDGDAVTDSQFLDGVLAYLAANGLGGTINVKHQDDGTAGGPGGGNYTGHGHTSTGHGMPTAAFVVSEICGGEDVEVGYTRADGSGHWVNAVKGGYLMGVPFVFYVSDHDQSDDTAGTGTVDFGFLVDTDGDGLPNLVGEPGNPNVDIVVSESPN